MLGKRIVVLCVLVCLSVVACRGAGRGLPWGGAKTVKVAVSMPTGMEIGEDMLNAARLALDEIDGKAGNVTVELLIFNTSDPEGSPVSPDLEKDAATEASQDQAVVAYLGAPTSDQAKASMAVLNEAGILQLSPSATWPGLTKPGFAPGEPGIYYPTGRKHFFRVTPSDEVQGEVAARWAKQLGVQVVYIVDDGTVYGQGIAGIFQVSVQDLGIRVFSTADFDAANPTTQVLNSIASRIITAEPDLVFLGSSLGNGGGEFIRELRSQVPEIAIMAPDGMVQDQLITDVGADLAEGIYGTNVIVPADQLESAAGFLASYQAAYGKEPPAYAVTTYEAMKVILYAIEHAENPTREDVLDAAAQIGEFPGILGRWQFDARGDISEVAISGFRIQNGTWTFVEVIK